MLGSKKNAGLVSIRFTDLPPLTPEERDDPTGFVATFKLLELEIIPSMPKLPYDHTYTLYASLGQSPDQSASTLINPAMDSIYSEEQWDTLTREQQESWLNQQVQTWANSRLHLSWTR